MIYALLVWYLGEGMGGIMTGASPLSGFPGGVVLYALIALLLWPPDAVRDRMAAPALNGKLGRPGALAAWATLWLSFSYYFLLTANRALTPWRASLPPVAQANPVGSHPSKPPWLTLSAPTVPKCQCYLLS